MQHNVVLPASFKDPHRRLWYARQAIEHGWSRAVLVHRIESDLYWRQGKAVTNFPATLPPAQSGLAAGVIKDPYSFDFLALGPDAAEYALRNLAKPVGVARYVTPLVEKLPVGLKGVLPAPREIEAELYKTKDRGTKRST